MNNLRILYEDNHLLVVDKPAGMATMGTESGPTLHSLAADYFRKKYNKPGHVYVGVVSRLDAMTSGVIVLARTSKAASRLAPQFSPDSKSKSKAAKTYLAVVAGQLETSVGSFADHLAKDDDAKRMRIVSKTTPGARFAALRYVVIGSDGELTLVAVKLDTGRKHQIRIQFASRGHVVMGDRKYGSRLPFSDGIALHSAQLQVDHPTLDQRMSWTALPPKSWDALLRKLKLDGKLFDRIGRLDWMTHDKGTNSAT